MTADGAGMPLAILGFRTQLHNALRHGGVGSVEGLLRLPPARLAATRGVGPQGLREALEARAAWAREHPDAPAPVEEDVTPAASAARDDTALVPEAEGGMPATPATLDGVVARWFRLLRGRQGEIIAEWLGLAAPLPAVSAIATRRGVSRQRAWAVVQKGLRRLHAAPLGAWIAPYVAFLARLVQEMGGILSAAEVRARLPGAVPLGDLDPAAASRLLCAASEDLVWRRAEGSVALAGPHLRIPAVRRDLQEIVRRMGFPIPASEVLARYVAAHPSDVDAAFVGACLRTDPWMEYRDGQVRPAGPSRHTTRARVIAALRAIGEPATAGEILEELQAHGEELCQQTLWTQLCGQRGVFMRVERGRYALADWHPAGRSACGEDERVNLRPLRCPTCGAALGPSPTKSSLTCAYCGVRLQVTEAASGVPMPRLTEATRDTSCLAQERAYERMTGSLASTEPQVGPSFAARIAALAPLNRSASPTKLSTVMILRGTPMGFCFVPDLGVAPIGTVPAKVGKTFSTPVSGSTSATPVPLVPGHQDPGLSVPSCRVRPLQR